MLNKIKGINEGKIITISLFIGLLVSILFVFCTKSYAEAVSSNLNKNFIRFHVLANSDLKEDQDLKLKVRDGVLESLKSRLSESSNINETREVLNANLTEIQNTAEEIIRLEGYDYKVKVSLSQSTFPTKSYGDVTLPAGEYEALRIEIGNGDGKNWWCVMFPPLCYVDITQNTLPKETKDELKNILPEEDYDLITQGVKGDNVEVKVKFKIVQWWQEQKLTSPYVTMNK